MPISLISLDLGATKCAAGIVSYDEISGQFNCLNSCHIKLADTSSLPDLIAQIETQLAISMCDAAAICIGAAGQYNGRELCHLSGAYPYAMPFAALAEEQHWPPYAVIHDYDTVVCATFTSYMQNPKNIFRLNDCKLQPHQRRVALGLGTGLGLKDGVLLTNGDFWLGKNEIGHIGITNPPRASAQRLAQHQTFMQFLYQHQIKTQQQITFENILTGRGLVHLHEFLYPNETAITPETAGERISTGKTPELLDMFAWYLGLFIGTVQLIFMPEGGIWITGGVVIKNLDLFAQSSFNEGIAALPSYQHERNSHPLGVMVNAEHALIGAGFYAVRRVMRSKGIIEKIA
jgi:glucokinase